MEIFYFLFYFPPLPWPPPPAPPPLPTIRTSLVESNGVPLGIRAKELAHFVSLNQVVKTFSESIWIQAYTMFGIPYIKWRALPQQLLDLKRACLDCCGRSLSCGFLWCMHPTKNITKIILFNYLFYYFIILFLFLFIISFNFLFSFFFLIFFMITNFLEGK
jgi:hypothetical protein